MSIVLDEPARFFKLRFAKWIRIRRRAFSRWVLRPYPNPRSKKSTQREKERKKDESTEFKNVEQNWSLLSAQEVTTCGGQHHKKVNNSALAARVSYAGRVRFPETNPGCNLDYGAVANPECDSGWTPRWVPDSLQGWVPGWPPGSLLGRHSAHTSMWEL